MWTWDPLIPSFDPSSSHDFLEVEFPSQEELFEAMSFNYQRSPWLEPRNGLALNNYLLKMATRNAKNRNVINNISGTVVGHRNKE